VHLPNCITNPPITNPASLTSSCKGRESSRGHLEVGTQDSGMLILKRRFGLTPWVGRTNKLARGFFLKNQGAFPDRQVELPVLLFSLNCSPREQLPPESGASCERQLSRSRTVLSTKRTYSASGHQSCKIGKPKSNDLRNNMGLNLGSTSADYVPFFRKTFRIILPDDSLAQSRPTRLRFTIHD
jgi:hypothetical protein